VRKNLISLSLVFSVISFAPLQSHAFLGFGKSVNTNNPLIEATELGNVDYVKELINKGLDVNSVDKNGKTALMKAAEAGNDQMVAALLTSGADIQMSDSKGNTALHYAAANDHGSTTKMLISNGAIINVTNKRGQTPLALAVKNSSVYAIREIDPGALSVVETNAGFTIAAASAASGGMSTTAVVTAGAGVAAAGAGIAAAAGGGGGGEESSSSGGNSGDDENEEEPDSDPDSDPDNGNSGGGSSVPTPDFNAEFNVQQGLKAVNADIAYSNGYTGEGVTVAVVDTGVDFGLFEMSGNLTSGATFNNGANVGNGDSEGFPILNISDIVKINNNNANFWHGTHVAGIIASKRNGYNMHGVAYDATILPVNVSTVVDSSGKNDLYDIDIAKGIDYSINKARVINISLGGVNPIPSVKTAIGNAVAVTGSNSIVVVAAAGNLYDGGVPGGLVDNSGTNGDDPVYPAYYAGDATINPGTPDMGDAIDDGGALLAVGAVDNNGNMASFSNRCGAAKNWCLVAPGVDIASNLPDNAYIARASGTSMAAPHVSGAAALLIDKDPHLTGREVAEILLLTADPLGADEISDDYGHGLLNIDSAINNPIGTTSIVLGNNVNGATVGLNNSSINVSSAFGDSFSSADLSFMILDDYKRAYYVDMDEINYDSNSITSFENKFRDFGNDITMQREEIAENVSFAAVNLTEKDPTEEEQEEFVRLSFATNTENGGFEFNYNVPMNQAFRMSALEDVSTSIDNVGANSVLGLVSFGTSNNNRYVIDKHSSVSFGSFQGEQDYGDVSGVVSQYSRSKNSWDMAMQFGMMNEESSFLGSETDGAFSVDENTPTWFYNFASGYNVSNDIKLFGSLNYGISFPKAAAESLIKDISNIQTYSFSGGVSKKAIFDERDKFEFIVSQPLKVIDGNANVALPVSRDVSGNITSVNHNLSLSPSGTQIDYGAFYSISYNKKSNLSAGAVYITQPGHIKSASDEMVFMAKYGMNF
jgi:subtilase-type serine protease